jgi:hypothetical protein
MISPEQFFFKKKPAISALRDQIKRPDIFTTMYIGSDNTRPCIQVGLHLGNNEKEA